MGPVYKALLVGKKPVEIAWVHQTFKRFLASSSKGDWLPLREIGRLRMNRGAYSESAGEKLRCGTRNRHAADMKFHAI
jgi:hypothetical protein